MSAEPGNARTDSRPVAHPAARSQRFTSRVWARWLVGCLLFLIFTGVILTLVVTLAAVLGLTPGS